MGQQLGTTHRSHHARQRRDVLLVDDFWPSSDQPEINTLVVSVKWPVNRAGVFTHVNVGTWAVLWDRLPHPHPLVLMRLPHRGANPKMHPTFQKGPAGGRALTKNHC